jgi:UDP-GlcNAc:undecaprenyl-phosphate GlcNAc-1-phosphate transferase
VTPLLVFALALGVSFFGTPYVVRLAQKLNAVDTPDSGRRFHRGPTARLGGVVLAAGFGAAVGLSFILPVPRNDSLEVFRVGGLLVGLLIVLAVGIYDDMHELPAGPQFLAQFVAAAIVILLGVRIDELPTPFGSTTLPEWFAILFTLFWLMGMMNTVNFIDGLDGLASGVVGIACLILFLHTARLGQTSIAILPLALIGAIIGFLPYNFAPAKIFLGTSGALFIGLALGALSIIGGAKVASALLVLGIPILDTAWQIIRRIRDGRAPYHGDRGHLHFRLVDRGWPQRQVVLMLYTLTAIFGGMALLLPSGMLKLAALMLMGAVMLGMMLWLTRRAE